MTPVLFPSNETAFTSNGLGRLTDARACEVTEERNGQYELYMEYPTNGALINYLVAGNYILATHDNNGDAQPFQIYSTEESLDGFIVIRAWHLSYLLNNIILKPFTAGSITETIAAIPNKSINNNPFTFWTDKQVTSDFELAVPKSVRAVLGGSEGSILDTYGKGEYEFDLFTVRLYLNRGQDRGVTIRYGKNLVSLDRELDASNVFNAVVPFWANEDTTVSLDHTVVKTGQTEGRAIALDLSDKWDEAPTTSQLEAAAQAYVDGSDNYQIRENLKIDFVQLWQTSEYQNVANLQRVSLCDTVHVIYRGITATAKCIKVVYDTLRERYSSMELGEPRTSLAQQINKDVIQPALAGVPSKSTIMSAIDRATAMISGGFGGYIKYKYLSNGTPSEQLIMDSPDEATATHIIRLNQNGIGFSTDGGATYRNAWTIDGQLNADFITTGNLIASVITTGLLQDATGKNYWNLDTGQFVTKQGQIGGFTIGDTALTSGDVDGAQTSGAKIDPTGIIYSDGSRVRTKLTQMFGLQYYDATENAWKDGPAYAMTTISGTGGATGTGAVIYADKSNWDIGAQFGTAPWTTYNGDDFYNMIRRNTRLIGLLSATNLKLDNALSIDQGGTGQTSAPAALEALSGGHVFLNKAITAGSPAALDLGGSASNAFWGGVLVGFVQNVGPLVLGITYNSALTTPITARNLMTNGSWSSSTLDFSVSGNTLTVSTNQSGYSYFSLFVS